ncbi:barstar family protein [Paenibacillus ginsengihumi]|jgi:ribonuclease inhibitor|uniref:barstar family protein n=1 Tax=Paenibacillus ginsengihumi TaxID=431596 RepID=UPI00037220C7|nr:barstar family protein [Paenibacillus ginsengihumi]
MRTITIDGTQIESASQMHDFLKEALGLPDYYGGNLDALWDGLTGWVETPLTIQWEHFQESEVRLGEYSRRLLELLEDAAKEVDGLHLLIKD